MLFPVLFFRKGLLQNSEILQYMASFRTSMPYRLKLCHFTATLSYSILINKTLLSLSLNLTAFISKPHPTFTDLFYRYRLFCRYGLFYRYNLFYKNTVYSIDTFHSRSLLKNRSSCFVLGCANKEALLPYSNSEPSQRNAAFSQAWRANPIS